MNTLKHTDPDFAKRVEQLLASSSLFDPVIEDRTRAIIQAVRERGDAALLELTEKFDGARLKANQLAVGKAEFQKVSKVAAKELRSTLIFAARNREI